MRIALVHDWLMEMGDREKTFLALAELFPGADIYTLAYNRDLFDPLMSMRKITVSALQSIPGGAKNRLAYFPLYQGLVGRLDLTSYDLVVSSSSVCAKWVRTSKTAMHVSYCHGTFEAAWSLPDALFDGRWFSPSSWPGKLFSRYLKWCDLQSNPGVKHFMAASTDIQTKIKNVYGRDSEVFFPPVELEGFQKVREPGERFLLVVDQTPSSSTLKILRFLKEASVPLLLLVRGGSLGRWQKMADETIRVEVEKDLPLAQALSQARGMICLEGETYPLLAAQSLAAGCPLWLEEGAALSDLLVLGETGLRFSPTTISQDVAQFRKITFDPEKLRQSVNRFSKARFQFKTQVYFRRLFGMETQTENENLS